MASFQIHEDVENIHSKIYAKKFINEVDEKRITKKKFGENNTVSIQPFNKNGVKGVRTTRIPIKNHKAGKGQNKKTKNITENDNDEVSFDFVCFVSNII